MIIAKTPFRMSFFGGGTDFKEFFLEHGGSVIASTFDKYCYVNVRQLPPFFEYKNELIYSKIERVSNREDVKHPAIRNAMIYKNINNIRLTYDADLPARSGLGTSSAFASGMLNAFSALQGEYIDKKTLAKDAIYLERDLCNEAGGWQDQVSCTFGGLNKISFHDSGFQIEPVTISKDRKSELESNLLLFFTGFTRFSTDVQDVVVKSIKDKTRELLEMKSLVHEAETILVNSKSNISDFGRLLDYSWKLKRSISKDISSNNIDLIYRKAMNCGALGGKLLGAGGGGFFLFYVEKDKQLRFINDLSDLLHIPFKFEEIGTHVVYYAS